MELDGITYSTNNKYSSNSSITNGWCFMVQGLRPWGQVGPPDIIEPGTTPHLVCERNGSESTTTHLTKICLKAPTGFRICFTATGRIAQGSYSNDTLRWWIFARDESKPPTRKNRFVKTRSPMNTNQHKYCFLLWLLAKACFKQFVPIFSPEIIYSQIDCCTTTSTTPLTPQRIDALFETPLLTDSKPNDRNGLIIPGCLQKVVPPLNK